MKPILYIGPRNYSSWSMRPWLVLKWAGIDFSEILVDLDAEGYGKKAIKAVLEVSPSGTVPVLNIGDALIADSLAISEWAHENAINPVYPNDATPRALCRSLVCEMHSGFGNIRNDLPHNIRRIIPTPPLSVDVKAEIKRFDEIASSAGGGFLFGEKSIADAFYTPMAVRMRTYSIKLSDKAQKYCDLLLNTPEFLEWSKIGEAEWKPFKAGPWDTIYS